MSKLVLNTLVILVEATSGKIFDTNESERIIQKAFESIIDTKRNQTLSYTINEDNKLCPSINFITVPNLQQAFNREIHSQGAICMSISREHLTILKNASINPQTSNLSQLIPFSKLVLGTVGIRKTNRDISYEVRIDGLPTKDILSILNKNIRITNEDRSNMIREVGYKLTCKNEVESFMTLCGLATLYLETIAQIEAHQQLHRLKEMYNGERIEDEAETKQITVQLAA